MAGRFVCGDGWLCRPVGHAFQRFSRSANFTQALSCPRPVITIEAFTRLAPWTSDLPLYRRLVILDKCTLPLGACWFRFWMGLKAPNKTHFLKHKKPGREARLLP
jgi:hypothetical protein